MTATGVGGGEPIPPDGAVLMATGALAAKLQAEAPVGTPLDDAADPAARVDGRHVRARRRPGARARTAKPVFRSLEDFTNDQVTRARRRAPASASSPTGAIILVAVDGGQPGYSVGLTTLRARADDGAPRRGHRRRASTRATSVTVAFDGQLLNQPSDPAASGR